jgi:hypothetical protein
MNIHNRAIIRQVILDRILEINREFLHDIAEWHDLDPFEVMEFYEEQTKRIDKMFNFPNSYLASLPNE